MSSVLGLHLGQVAGEVAGVLEGIQLTLFLSLNSLV